MKQDKSKITELSAGNNKTADNSVDTKINDNWDDVYDENGDFVNPEMTKLTQSFNDKLKIDDREKLKNEVSCIYIHIIGIIWYKRI